MWIRAKYIQKAFIRRLPMIAGESSPEEPASETGNDGGATGSREPAKAKRWSVMKRKRRSPPKGRGAGGDEKEGLLTIKQGEVAGFEKNQKKCIVFR